MSNQTIKIYNSHDFEQITKGVKVAQFMQEKSEDAKENVDKSDAPVTTAKLCCSYCNAIFENIGEQRLHYKLDWHRFNLKQQLQGLKPVSEHNFNLITNKDTCSSSESVRLKNTGQNKNSTNKNKSDKTRADSNDAEEEKSESGIKTNEAQIFNGDESSSQDDSMKKDTSLPTTSRRSKILFENQDGNVFSIYNCLLLHKKKAISEIDHDTIIEILTKKDESLWTIIMVGSGHFAGAVFSANGSPLIHKTLHAYTVRAKQGTSQHSRDNRHYCKSAGATLRRTNELHFMQKVQKTLKTWAPYLTNSSLILYRAVGPHNRTIFFGGKDAPLDKTDSRLRPLPFPTRKPTFKEICRVYDLLNTVEVYSSATSYANDSPSSRRSALQEKKIVDSPIADKSVDDVAKEDNSTVVESPPSNSKRKKNSRAQVEGAKPMKSHKKLLPDIVSRLAGISLESELDMFEIDDIQDLIESTSSIDLKDRLQEFENTPIPKSRSRVKKNHKTTPKTSNKN